MLIINKKPLHHFIIEKAIKENINNIFISMFKSEIIKIYFKMEKNLNKYLMV